MPTVTTDAGAAATSDPRVLADAPEDEPTGRALTAALVAVPMALFAVHLVVAYTLISLRCQEGLLAGSAAGIEWARWVTFGISVAGAVALVALALVARRRLAAVRDGSLDRNGRAGFLLAGSAALSALLAVYMVMAATMVIVAPACTT